jgi:hypothetical protein
MQKPKLTNKDHKAMDAMLSDLLDAFENGDLSKSTVNSGLAHIIAALDRGNTSEAVVWFKQKDLAFFKDMEKHFTSVGLTGKKKKSTTKVTK